MTAQEVPWCLRDEGARSVEFAEFRADFQKALADRDLAALKILSAESIWVGSSEYSFDAFVEHAVAPPGGERDTWWRDAEQAMRVGGVFFRNRFCAPLVSCEWSPDAEPTDLVVLQDNAEAFERPNTSSARRGALQVCQRVRRTDAVRGWVAVELSGGLNVWVEEAAVRPRASSTLQFQRVGTSWRFEAFATIWP